MKLPAWAAVLALVLVLAFVALEPVVGQQEQWPRNEDGEEDEDEGTYARPCTSGARTMLHSTCCDSEPEHSRRGQMILISTKTKWIL